MAIGRGRRAVLLVGLTTASLLLGAAGALTATPADAASDMVAATTTVNIRSGSSTSSKIVGQLDRGQRITLLGKASKGWLKVRFNHATAYIFGEYLNTSGKNPPAAPKKINSSGTHIATTALNVRSGAATSKSIVGSLAEGARVPLTGKFSNGFAETRYGGKLRWVSVQYVARIYTAVAAPTPAPVPSGRKGEVALAYAEAQLGKPYRWGASGPNSFDCSGLVLMAWRSAGVSLPRTSQEQFKVGAHIAKADLKPGDLVFFYGPSPSHVGLYVGGGKIIHSPRPGKTVSYSQLSYMPYAGARRPG